MSRQLLIQASIRGTDEFTSVDPTIENEVVAEALTDLAKMQREELKSEVICLLHKTEQHKKALVSKIRIARKTIEAAKKALDVLDDARAVMDKEGNFVPLMMITDGNTLCEVPSDQLDNVWPARFRKV